MASYLTSNTLIESIKRRAMLPSNQSTFSDADFLALANEEMNIGIVPSIILQHQNYLQAVSDQPMLPNTSSYPIPYRAIGNMLNDVFYVDTSLNYFEMTRIQKSDLPDFNGPYSQGYARLFYVENNEIVLYPTITGQVSGSINMAYYIRPNQLVTEDRVGIITGIDTVTGDITVTKVPSVFSTSQSYDFIQLISPHKTLAFDIGPVSINTTTNTINFAPGTLPAGLSVGDHINLSEESIIPQIPSDLHVVLAHRVAARCLEALGDTQGLQNANAKLAEMEVKTANLINNRVEGAPLKLVSRNNHIHRGLTSRRFRRR